MISRFASKYLRALLTGSVLSGGLWFRGCPGIYPECALMAVIMGLGLLFYTPLGLVPQKTNLRFP